MLHHTHRTHLLPHMLLRDKNTISFLFNDRNNVIRKKIKKNLSIHRESLFAPVFKNKITQAPNQSSGTLRFSTFGYDTAPGSGGCGGGCMSGGGGSDKTLRRQSTHTKDKSQTLANTLEMDDFSHLADIPPPPIVCSKHDPTKKNIKMEESRIYVDIRNSAPDVIIMTSH